MECYEGATMSKSFRGRLGDGAQDTIVLHTSDGSTGYRIKKFQIFPSEPGEQNIESVAKIYKVSQSTFDNTVDFSDNTLLAVAYYQDGTDQATGAPVIIIFDNEIFNQDIYITAIDATSDQKTNYYLELEQVKLDLGENTVATLKNIKNEATNIL